jgi:hypothetical protein
MLVFSRFPSGLRGLWRGVVALAVVPLFLVACDTPNPNPGFPELTFTHKPSIRLNVAKIEIINEYRMPFKAPNIEHLVPVAPGATAERWAADVLKPAGTRGTAQFVITRAPFTEEKLKTKSGIQGIFSIDQSERYEAVLEARIVILDGNRRVGTVRAIASRSRTAREDASPNQRAKQWYAMVERLMADFDAEMRGQVGTHLRKHLR